MIYTYKLISTGGSSVKYGDCEVCKHPATEMFHQTEELIYERDGAQHTTRHNCTDLFGHESCLVSRRRQASKEEIKP